MTPDFRQKLRGLLLQDEGLRTHPYTDIVGKISIGVGRNLTDRGISANEAFLLLDDDIAYFIDRLQVTLPFFPRLNEARQIVLVNICFNCGVQGFLGFIKMIEALKRDDYEEAAQEILDSDAARLLPARYERLAQIMKTGEIHV